MSTRCAMTECSYEHTHQHCPSCGLAIPAGELCLHHAQVYGDDWAASNRVMCDFIHRAIVPARLPETERADDTTYAYA